MAIAIAFLAGATGFPSSARITPVTAAVTLFGIASLQLRRAQFPSLRDPQPKDILDLPLASKPPEWRRSAPVLLAFLGLFLLASVNFGPHWAAIGLAAVLPASLSGRKLAPWGLLTGALVAAPALAALYLTPLADAR